jgi:NAD(P)-dependent dehydrogenase (short-subunit alcohol dehydrogenase family)
MAYDKSMTRQTIIITGASAGIGEAAARELAKDNDVIIVGRSKQRTAKIAKELGAPYYLADYSDLSSVRTLAKDLLKAYPKIDLLINNAGGMMKEIKKTKDGFEETFQVNYLAQFVLTNMLMDRLISSKAGVINTASAANYSSFLNLKDLQAVKSTWIAYSNSKLLDIIHAKELSRRYLSKGVTAVSLHPGVVATNFAKKLKGPFAWLYNTSLKRLIKTPKAGADTMVWLARNRAGWVPGAYYSNRKIRTPHRLATEIVKTSKIWNDTETMLAGVK